jgi:hypothetical protein
MTKYDERHADESHADALEKAAEWLSGYCASPKPFETYNSPTHHLEAVRSASRFFRWRARSAKEGEENVSVVSTAEMSSMQSQAPALRILKNNQAAKLDRRSDPSLHDERVQRAKAVWQEKRKIAAAAKYRKVTKVTAKGRNNGR